MAVEDSIPADDQLAAFIDRILRMKEEADAIAADIKEIYAEAKAMGFDKTRLGDTVTKARKVAKDANAEAEKEALNDLYWTAYCRVKNKPHAHAYARGGKEIGSKASNSGLHSTKSASEEITPEHDAETGEIIEPQSAPQAARDLATSPSPQGQVATNSDIGMPISNELPPASRGTAGEDDLRELAATVPGRIAQEGDAPLEASTNVTGEGMSGHAAHLSTDFAEPDATPAGAVVADRSGVTGGERAATNYLKASTGDAQFRDPLDWEDEDGALPIQSHRDETSEGQSLSALCDKADMTGKTAGADAPAAPDNTIIFKAKPLRPNCLKPEACAGQGRNHCWPCRKAMAEEGAA